MNHSMCGVARLNDKAQYLLTLAGLSGLWSVPGLKYKRSNPQNPVAMRFLDDMGVLLLEAPAWLGSTGDSGVFAQGALFVGVEPLNPVTPKVRTQNRY